MTEEREQMELDVVFIGAGPANLTAAYCLMKNIEAYNEKAQAEGKDQIEEPMVLVIDKASEVGNHTLSGAVVDPKAFREIFPDVAEEDMPFRSPVTDDQVFYLTKNGKMPVPGPFLPGPMHNQPSFYVASAAELTRWLAEKCEEVGVEVYTEFAVNELIMEDGKVKGAKIADKGLDEEGEPTEAFAAGMDLEARVTVIGEGTRGYIAQQIIDEMGLAADANPQVWGVGVKEVIEIPEGRYPKGKVTHTFGYPLDMKTYGGSFMYGLDETHVAIGLVMGLDYPNPLLETHSMFLQYKQHPLIQSVIRDGKVMEYGAKTLPEGGYYALPRLAVDGAVLVGDSAGFVNMMRLKGLHLAMKSGALAADRICQALAKDDVSAAALDYRQDFENSWAGEEMRRSRNFRQPYHKGLPAGMFFTGLNMFSGGALPGGRQTMPPDFQGLKPASEGVAMPKIATDDELNLDLLTDVYKSGSVHREDQACHCRILDTELCKRCKQEYDAPCTKFCPAKVYEENLDADGNFVDIQVNFSNCVHCKTCEIKDPFENVRWVPPEGGDGPKYQAM